MQRPRFVRIVRALLVIGACMSVAAPMGAQTAPDNTKVNKRDRAKTAVTADQQKENAADRDLVKRIRQSLMKDKSLSTYARNVKIVAQGGQVTLKGPVRSDAEKQSIEMKATEIAGAEHVTSQISVAPAATPKSPKD